ncbi:hypothetical protein [Cryobacterium sp. Y62]|uniref:hypothetical protein n=1 Tax=Cryobacterium sp. Y62 TaxID=2048284 RepID=UPI000CE3EB21|nr:hypothetical protein [Cryobacterium sp. Y62]
MTRTNDSQPTDSTDGADDTTESSATPDAKNTSADTTDTQQTDTTESSTDTASTEASDAHSHLPYDAQQTLPFDSNATVPLNGTLVAANDANATLPFAAASTGYATPSVPVDPAAPKPRTWYRKPVAIGGMAAAVIILGGAGIGLGIAANSGANAELASNNSRTLNGPGQGESDSAGGPRLSTGMAALDAQGPALSGTVLAVSGDTITITDSDGFVRTINVTDDTEYGDELAADFEEGLEIRATGTINDDDTSLDATWITTATAGHGINGRIDGPGIVGPGIGGGHGGPRGADAGTTVTPLTDGGAPVTPTDPPSTPAA